MLEDLTMVEGEYLRDILHQPLALENTLASLETSKPLQNVAARLNQGKFQRVVLTGMGSSFHALHPLNLELISHGFTALMVETSELVHYKNRFFDPKTLIIAVSQSGQSAEMVRLVQTNHKRCTVIAVTNTPGSPLAKHANATVLTQAGNEFSVSCKTYVTAVMALKWLGGVLCERDLRRVCRELKQAAPAVACLPCRLEGLCSHPGSGAQKHSSPVFGRPWSVVGHRRNGRVDHQRVHPLSRRGHEQRRFPARTL